MPRTKRFHALKRPKLRQDWSKWNLYNLTRVTTPPASNKTFFQQKWAAKSMLRSYHNPDVREGTWTRMFDRRLPAVVPMDHRYLAKEDGSEMAKGRGMGVEKSPVEEQDARTGAARNRANQKTPYMHMTFHPLERRLDTSIFRALFASSTRQARQFVVHGFVKVNGKKMKYPGYQLNPGDMFSVEPDMVLFATGARKMKKDDNRSNLEVQRAYLKRQEREEETNEQRSRRREQEAEDAMEEDVDAEELEDGASPGDGVAVVDPKTNYGTELRALMKRAKVILADSKRDLSGKSKIELRNFTRQVKTVFAKLRKTEESETEATLEGLETTLAEILTKVPQDSVPQSENPASTEVTDAAASSETPAQSIKENANRARKDAELLHAALERARANPIDQSKPYATPWEPREFMSAFAFIPRYLEVNQNICSAVYLRHPVARPGLAEVPTPFSAETMALGFNWYLRRR
ncbi:unnamed protein product [Zymoseptoria tritici ST99CH_1A5]|uniref:Small ribosomal subunit protein uS4m n=4 Tax=Zymoseptoria tritici TaxID=1047171 RepID=F9XLL6_ZYMTI|nr:uncharacterized protein MYCGRDRAFT_110991 [Zymoseptoria tritici IPO323]SMQ54602.1 unnamed protein product [Zymoseptoria tritici ST99CH_3D7]SMR59038.1 unnamed protein product [Zymoseptoria tritici ST99CH_1E4]SMR62878.1 unnamed protein product [Zymoseptoria tritici ST99CH_3D1]SMY28247.1 unnamed protein product [Zymoseptoria tritici ST99CH_1A5]EGP84146.1 hypothetical protein MYCGRDRAFT_110991 [Zymoseptoria tritici IPO323]